MPIRILRRLGTWIFPHIPEDDEQWYRLCRFFVNRYLGENNDDIHTNGELTFLKARLPFAQVVFDVGANIGDWSALALEINPSIALHCFEPSTATFDSLRARALVGNITLNPSGLGSLPGVKSLYVFEEGSGLNSLYQRRGLEEGWNLQSPTRAEEIQLDTLDRYCQEKGIEGIDLLKVDVEGYELEVFKGGALLLSQQRIKSIQFEYGGCNIDARVLLEDYFDFFHSYSYELYKIYPTRLKHYPVYDQRLENFQYQNWAALCRSEAGRLNSLFTA